MRFPYQVPQQTQNNNRATDPRKTGAGSSNFSNAGGRASGRWPRRRTRSLGRSNGPLEMRCEMMRRRRRRLPPRHLPQGIRGLCLSATVACCESALGPTNGAAGRGGGGGGGEAAPRWRGGGGHTVPTTMARRRRPHGPDNAPIEGVRSNGILVDGKICVSQIWYMVGTN